MCEHAYIKLNPKNQCKMYFCHRFDKEPDIGNQLCIRQRYCTKESSYIFYKESQCRFYINKYTEESHG